MHDPADLIKALVEPCVSGCIGGRVHRTLHLIAVEVNDHHVLRSEFFVRNTARFDDKKPFFPVNAAYVAPRKCDQSILRKKHVGFIDFSLQIFQHLIASLSTFRQLL